MKNSAKMIELNEKIKIASDKSQSALDIRDSILTGYIEFQTVYDSNGCHGLIHHEVEGVACYFEYHADGQMVSSHPGDTSIVKVQESWVTAELNSRIAAREVQKLLRIRDNAATAA